MNSTSKPSWRVNITPIASMVGLEPVNCSDKERSGIHDCKVVRIESPNIVTHWSDQRDHIYSVGSDAVITLDGRKCELTNLKLVWTIRMTTKRDGQLAAVSRIDSSPRLRRKYR